MQTVFRLAPHPHRIGAHRCAPGGARCGARCSIFKNSVPGAVLGALLGATKVESRNIGGKLMLHRFGGVGFPVRLFLKTFSKDY